MLILKYNNLFRSKTIRSFLRTQKTHALNSLKEFPKDDYTNVTEGILSLIGKNLHQRKNHPLNLLTQQVVAYFNEHFVGSTGSPIFKIFDDLNPPIVSIEQNFDSLLIPKDHVSRSKSDCYYLNRNHLLRAHMTAHQSELIKSGHDNFLMIGDVYRRDEIDKTHYPVFHQIDGVRLRSSNDPESEMKDALSGLTSRLFGPDCKFRWVDAYFPFTEPSFELEIHHDGDWMEVLGCGIIREPIIRNCGRRESGWAFGIGVERLAMHLFKIPDIRLFWSNDTGFLSQFEGGGIVTYKPVSQYPQCKNDISFWLPEAGYNSNDFYDLVRSIGGDVVEQVSLVDEFKHPKNKKTSHCYRIVYRHMERTLTQAEVNVLHKSIEEKARTLLNVKIR